MTDQGCRTAQNSGSKKYVTDAAAMYCMFDWNASRALTPDMPTPTLVSVSADVRTRAETNALFSRPSWSVAKGRSSEFLKFLSRDSSSTSPSTRPPNSWVIPAPAPQVL